MKKYFMLALCLSVLPSIFSYAQAHNFRVDIGGMKDNLVNQLQLEKGISPIVGVEYRYNFIKKAKALGLSTGAIYYKSKVSNFINSHQIQVPLLLNVNVGQKFKADFSLGIVMNNILSYEENGFYTISNTFRNEFRPISLSLMERITFRYQVTDKHSIGLNIALSNGVTSAAPSFLVNNHGELSILKNRMYYLKFGLVYEFAWF